MQQKALNSEANLDFIESGTYAASKAISDERIEAIANLVANGLGEGETDAIRRKRLLGLLNQVDDDGRA